MTRATVPLKPSDMSEEDAPFLMSEMECALVSMSSGKSTGIDGVATEMLQAMDKEAKQRILELLNEVYETGDMPEDFIKSIFIAIPKKPNSTECKDHRTIALIAHTAKLLLKMITARIKTKLEDVIAVEQFGFRKGVGTREAIFALRTICERAIQVQQDLYLCFIDYEKAFDRVQHSKMMEILKTQEIGKNNFKCISNLYWLQKAAVKVEEDIADWTSIERGVRQGCVLSPLLFNLYAEMVIRESAIQQLGIKIGGRNICNVRYADDTVLIAGSREDLQEMLNRINKTSEEYGLRLNLRKTKAMKVSKKNIKVGTLQRSVKLRCDGEDIEEVASFQYLGSVVTNDGRCQQEVKTRIAKAKNQFNRMRKFLCNRKISLELRKRIMKCYVWSVLLYGVETWTLNEDSYRRLKSFEMWCYRRMFKISWVKKITNKRVLEMAKEKEALMTIIMKRKAQYCGHLIRNHELLTTILEGKIEGKKARGRQRRMWMDDLREWLRIEKKIDILRACKERAKWKTMVGNLRDGEAT